MASKKLTVEQFTLRAIRNLRDCEKSKGIHVVYSGFNNAFREYFPKKVIKEELEKLVASGKIVMAMRRGGPIIYLPNEGPTDTSAEDALRRILDQDS